MNTSNRKSVHNFKTAGANAALQRLYELNQLLLPQFGDSVWMRHQQVTHHVSNTARTLYLDDLYKKIVDVPGVICEFGVQWGATLTHLINLRSIYEPFNHSRKLYGFDTFTGFPSVHENDTSEYNVGDLSVPEGYEAILEEILGLVESFAPKNNIKKFELIKGDVCETFDEWKEKNNSKIISLAIFDMDLYAPTKKVLEGIKPMLTKGSILAFDELTESEFPGECIALNEVFGLNNIRLQRSKFHPFCAWFEYGG